MVAWKWEMKGAVEKQRIGFDPADWFPFEGEQIEIYHQFFGDAYPANTIVGARFPQANVHLEIDAI